MNKSSECPISDVVFQYHFETERLNETITRIDYFFLVSGLLCAFAAYVLEKPYSDTIAYIGAGCISISIILLAYRFIRRKG